MRFAQTLTALFLVVPALAVPTRVPVTKRAGPVKPNSWIVTFRDAPTKNKWVNSNLPFKHPESRVDYSWGMIPAIAVTTMSSEDLDGLRQGAGIESIEPDPIVSINYEVNLDGLAPTHSQPPANTAESLERCNDNEGSNGKGVTIYGIDTGIFTAHECFGGRAVWGITFGGYEDKDGNGHGTHTAGTAIGRGFFTGCATGAKMVAVKVLSDDGSGATSDVMSGVEWAYNQSVSQGQPNMSIVTMSLGGMLSPGLDKMVRDAVKGGLHFTIAAGNSNQPAMLTSPADVNKANTIGAVDNSLKKAAFSNYGSVLDAFGLGVDVLSAWITSTTSNNTLSGTSMATPAVAGILAHTLGRHGPMSPEQLSKDLKSHGAPVVTLDKMSKLAGTTNILAVPW